MLVNRVTLALFAPRALFSFASPLNSFTIQVTVQDSSFSLKSNDICADEALAVPLELNDPELLKAKDPEIKLDAATFVGIEKGETHWLLGILICISSVSLLSRSPSNIVDTNVRPFYLILGMVIALFPVFVCRLADVLDAIRSQLDMGLESGAS